ncbi:MAG: hypothetical protein U1F43_19535 [Myxococcota bacterium]
MRIGLIVLAASLGGCYQATGLGNQNHFGGEPTGHSFEAHWVMTGDDIVDGGAMPTAGIDIIAGPWGLRSSDVLGAMVAEKVSDTMTGFVRPGLAVLVIGVEDDGRKNPPLWFGIGAVLEGGVMVRVGDGQFIEIGAKVSGDLGYSGDGTGAQAGVFIGYGFTTKWDLDLVTD